MHYRQDLVPGSAWWMRSPAAFTKLHTIGILRPPGQPAAWMVVGAMACIDVIWACRIGLTVHRTGNTVAAGLAMLALSLVYRSRSARIADIAEAAALWISFTSTGCVLTYLAATAALPLQDMWLSGFDRALGFDWAAWRDVVNGHPALHWVLSVAYASLLFQILFASMFLPFVGRTARGIELLMLSAAALVPTIAIATVCPALGPYPDGFAYLPDLLAIRGPGPWEFNLAAMQGIISMPSYHTALAVLFTYAHRETGPAGWSIALLNLIMLPAIPLMGDHYFVDMLAGFAIAILAIAGARLLYASVRRWSAEGI